MSRPNALPMKDYKIHVYNYVRDSGRNIPLAYVNYQGQGNCVHLVKAENHIVAKRLAIREHLQSNTCNQDDHFALSRVAHCSLGNHA